MEIKSRNSGQQKAIDKLDREMEAAKDPCSKYIAEMLIRHITQHPEQSKNVLGNKKLNLAVEEVRKVAKREAVKGVACVENERVLDIAFEYYGLTKPEIAQAGSVVTNNKAADIQALGEKVAPEVASGAGNGAEKAGVSLDLDEFF